MISNEKEIGEFIQLLEDIKSSMQILTNTLAIQSGQIIDLRGDIGEYHSDAKATRLFRTQVEADQMEGELNMLHRRMDALRNQAPITDKVKKIVRSELGANVTPAIQAELKKSQIDWMAVRQTAVQAGAGSVVVAVIWIIIRLLAGSVP